MQNILTFEQDINKVVHMRNLSGSLFENDDNGLRLRVKVTKNGAEETLSGSVIAYIVRSDGSVATRTGGITNGSIAYVNIPSSALMPGLLQITLKNVDGNYSTTLLAITGVVKAVSGSSYIDTGSVIPSLSSYSSLVTRIETAADTVEGLSTSSEVISGDRYRCIVTMS